MRGVNDDGSSGISNGALHGDDPLALKQYTHHKLATSRQQRQCENS
jgi:hypothetical protein